MGDVLRCALGFADLEGRRSLCHQQHAGVKRGPRCCPCCANASPNIRRRSWRRCSSASVCRLRRSGKPEELFGDEHLNATGGLADITLPDGQRLAQGAHNTAAIYDGRRTARHSIATASDGAQYPRTARAISMRLPSTIWSQRKPWRNDGWGSGSPRRTFTRAIN